MFVVIENEKHSREKKGKKYGEKNVKLTQIHKHINRDTLTHTHIHIEGCVMCVEKVLQKLKV